MKKFLCILYVFLFIATPSFAEDTPANMPKKTVEMSINKLQLKSKVLKKKYSAYSIKFVNTGDAPLQINNIQISNIVNDAEKFNNSYRLMSPISGALTAVAITSACLIPVTFGLSGIVAIGAEIINIPVFLVDIHNLKKSTAEAVKYNSARLLTAKNEIIMPEQFIDFNIAVPLNQTPIVEGVFENTNTHEYITVGN